MLTRRGLLQGIGWAVALPAGVVAAVRSMGHGIGERLILRSLTRDVYYIEVTKRQIIENEWTGLTLIAWDKNYQPRVVDHFGMRVIEYVQTLGGPRQVEITHPARHCGQRLRQRVIEQLRNETS